MITNISKGGEIMRKPIIVPYNEDTKYIYETYVKVAKRIAERNQREREKTTMSDGESKEAAVI